MTASLTDDRASDGFETATDNEEQAGRPRRAGSDSDAGFSVTPEARLLLVGRDASKLQAGPHLFLICI